MIRGFSRQIGAKLTVERVHGMRYIIDMPLEQVRPVTAPFVPAEMDPAA